MNSPSAMICPNDTFKSIALCLIRALRVFHFHSYYTAICVCLPPPHTLHFVNPRLAFLFQTTQRNKNKSEQNKFHSLKLANSNFNKSKWAKTHSWSSVCFFEKTLFWSKIISTTTNLLLFPRKFS